MHPQLGMPRTKSDWAHCLAWYSNLRMPHAGTMEGGVSTAGTQQLPLNRQLLWLPRSPTPSTARSPLSPRCSGWLLRSVPPAAAPSHCSAGGGAAPRSGTAAGPDPLPGLPARGARPAHPAAQELHEQRPERLRPGQRRPALCGDGGSMSSHLDSLESICCWSHNRSQEPLTTEQDGRNLPVLGDGGG